MLALLNAKRDFQKLFDATFSQQLPEAALAPAFSLKKAGSYAGIIKC